MLGLLDSLPEKEAAARKAEEAKGEEGEEAHVHAAEATKAPAAREPPPQPDPTPPQEPPREATREPPKARVPPELRILALDGGGMKGLCLVEILREIERRCGLPMSDLVDLVAGTSIGGAVALHIAQIGKAAVREAEAALEMLGREVFAKSSVFSLMTSGNKIPREVCVRSRDKGIGFAEQISGGANYESPPRAPAGGALGRDARRPHCFAVAAQYTDAAQFRAYHLRNYALPSTCTVAETEDLPGTNTAPLRVAFCATTAAPTYFAPVTWSEPIAGGGVNEVTMVDGGMVANNPSMDALVESAEMWPRRKVGCLVSLGCGKVTQTAAMSSSVLYWVGAMMDLAVNSYKTHHTMKQIMHTPLYSGTGYFRLDPPTGDYPLDESNVQTLAEMRDKTRKYIAKKSAKIDRLCLALLAHTLNEATDEHRALYTSLTANPEHVAAALGKLRLRAAAVAKQGGDPAAPTAPLAMTDLEA